MSKPASKTLIGLFVVGAVVLVVLAIALFGSGKFFTTRPKFVMYFSGSVNGLAVGSPVQFRGVKIGEVTSISATIDRNLSVVIPVYVEFDTESMTVPDELKKAMQGKKYPYFLKMVAKGLKAQLRMKSLITGQLYVALDFYPDKPIILTGLEKNYPEVPTIPSTSDVLMATLEKVPLTEISNKLEKVVDGVERIVNSPEVARSLKNLDASLRDLGVLIRDVDSEVKPLSTSLQDTSNAARGAFSQAEKTLAFNEGKPGEVAANLQNTLKKVDATLEELRLGIVTYEKLADRNMNIGYDLSKTLQEIDGAARSIRGLTDYLERHPEALVKGKQPAKGD
ncbi:MAG: MCE family protein [Deltaproteobacteria bacterium]|nr:MCE family protein [Deltaproteobacteria bacterium]